MRSTPLGCLLVLALTCAQPPRAAAQPSAESGPETESGSVTVTETETESGSVTETESETESESGSGSVTASESESGSGSASVPDPEPVPALPPPRWAEETTLPPIDDGFPARGDRVGPRPPPPPEALEPRGLYAPRPLAAGRYVPGRGFELQTEDGDFAVALGAWGQVEYRLDGRPGDDRHVLQIPRARLRAAGHLFGPNHRYVMLLGFAPTELQRRPVDVVGLPDPPTGQFGDEVSLATADDVVRQVPLLDLYFDFTHFRDLSLRVGQFRLPYSKQRMIPERARQFPQRALADREFELDRDLGATLHSEDLGGLDLLRYSAGMFIGEGPNPDADSLGAGDPGFMYLGRVDIFPAGRFDDRVEADFERAPYARVVLGAAFSLLQADASSPHAVRFLGVQPAGAEVQPRVDFNVYNATFDAMLKVSGFSSQAALYYRTFGGATGAREGLGLLLQAGYLFEPVALEPVARYSITRGSGTTSLPDVDELSVGLNYYLARNHLKLSLEYARLSGVRGSGLGEDRLHTMLQVAL